MGRSSSMGPVAQYVDTYWTQAAVVRRKQTQTDAKHPPSHCRTITAGSRIFLRGTGRSPQCASPAAKPAEQLENRWALTGLEGSNPSLSV